MLSESGTETYAHVRCGLCLGFPCQQLTKCTWEARSAWAGGLFSILDYDNDLRDNVLLAGIKGAFLLSSPELYQPECSKQSGPTGALDFSRNIAAKSQR